MSNWPPRYLTPVSEADLKRSAGHEIADFISLFGVVTKDSVAGRAGSPLHLRDWQKDLLNHAFAKTETGFKHKVSLVGVPRKNGKSALASGVAVWSLLAGPRGGEVYSCAADRDQARIVFGEAKKMIEADSELSGIVKLYRDAIEFPSTGSIYRVLSSEAFTKEGLSPTMVIFDELHAQPNRELFDVMSLAGGARGDISAGIFAITTAGVKSGNDGQDSIAFQLYNHGKSIASGETIDPSFFMAWFEADQEADHRDPQSWIDANPGYGDICDAGDFESSVKRTPEAEFRTKRLNQWVNTKTAWLPAGAWSELEDSFEMSPSDEYYLGFDGSWNNDSTGIVAVIPPRTEDDVYRVKRIASWEKNFTLDDDNWVIDKNEVTQTIFDFFDKFPNCKEMACDPSYWEDQMQLWAEYGLPVVEYRNSVQRTIPATSKLYEAIMNKKLRHDGDPALARHIDNCILKLDAGKGARITKDYRNPKLKIDLAICLLMAYDRASSKLEPQVIPEFFA